MNPGTHPPDSSVRHGLPLLSLVALGIVFGDIGTSPLYAFKVAVQASLTDHVALDEASIGVASLILWSLLIIVSFKYALLILRADNEGEGGVVAMLALLNVRHASRRNWRGHMLIIGLVGAALLYGDGAITPAISVLSAIEGLKTYAPHLGAAVVPLTVIILVGLFLVQPLGTGAIGRIFGPIMASWFVTIAVIGMIAIVRVPKVLMALNPWSAVRFALHAPPGVVFAVLGAVFLAVTGGEAMYADLGHFGRGPIRLAWFGFVLPALFVNYLGQAAVIVADPAAIRNPFYALAPGWAHYPLVALATLATVIASQAIITGVFSLTRQNIRMGFMPHLEVRHTAGSARGQIYVPAANWLLGATTLAAVILFRSSDALAGAYGIAVAGLMAISTLLATLIALRWGYSRWIVLPVNGLLIIVDLAFLAANSVKLREGGWFPLLIAAIVATVMLTWHRGVELLEAARDRERESESAFLGDLDKRAVCRVPGTAAFLSASEERIPLALSHHLRHNRALQEQVLLVSITTSEIPKVPASARTSVRRIRPGFERLILRRGFMEPIDVPGGLREAAAGLTDARLDDISYYVGHETVIADRRTKGMAHWREALFVWLLRNTAPTGASFGIPTRQVVEIGMEVQI
ncbi:MAG: KUP/HAK/KT family potassium transporter [Sphingomonas bacterium]